MKKRWQQWKERVAGWWRGIGQLRKNTKWRVWWGTGAGLLLAALVYFTLLGFAKPSPAASGILTSSTSDANEIEKRLSAIQEQLRQETGQNYSSARYFLLQYPSFDEMRVLLWVNALCRKLTAEKLLSLRNKALTGLTYAHRLRRARAEARIDDLDFTGQEDSVLASHELPLLLLVVASEQELARARLDYLNQQPQLARPLLDTTWQRQLAQLQMQDAQAKTLTKEQLNNLRQRELALTRTLELWQGDLPTTQGLLLDSCRRELIHLRLLDSCRQELTHWFPTAFGAAYVSANSREAITPPLPYVRDDTAILNERARWSIFNEIPVYIFLILVIVLAIGLSSLIQSRRGLRAGPPAPAPGLEPPVLQLLLLAYATTIRDALLMPRRIKRFAGKVRLQHYLLGALTQEPIRAENQFVFGPAEQVLAFLLLLVVEREAQLKHPPPKDEAEFSRQLTTAYQAAVETNLFEAAAGPQFNCQDGVVTLYLVPDQPAAPASAVTFALTAALTSNNAARLLKQLYWMNAGLLV